MFWGKMLSESGRGLRGLAVRFSGLRTSSTPCVSGKLGIVVSISCVFNTAGGVVVTGGWGCCPSATIAAVSEPSASSIGLTLLLMHLKQDAMSSSG